MSREEIDKIIKSKLKIDRGSNCSFTINTPNLAETITPDIFEKLKRTGISVKGGECGINNRIYYNFNDCKLQISTLFMGENNIILIEEGCNLKNNCFINIEGNNHIIVLRKGAGVSSLNVTMRGNEGLFYYGENCTSNRTDCLIHGNVVLYIGDDSMMAVNSVIRTYDSHAIIDLASSEQINKNQSVFIKKHVWLAQNSIVMPGVEIGSGSIVGAGAIVTKNVKNNILVAGIPARPIKTGVSWTREPFPTSCQISAVKNILNVNAI